jgi:Flp pilus assembly protein TadB
MAAWGQGRSNPARNAGPGARPPGRLGQSGQAGPPGRPVAPGRQGRRGQPSARERWARDRWTRDRWARDRWTRDRWTRIGRALAQLPRPGRAAAARREMEEAVPEVIDVLRATVAAGINPRRALQAAAEGAPSALEAVLDQAIRAAELGSGAGGALAAAARAEGLSELLLAGEALDLAETTGAPPGPVLSGVASAAADRVRSRQARMAATAEARLSARVVAAMAPAFLGVLALTSPSDAAFLVREPLGWATLAAAAVLELLGIAWATRIVRGPAP